MNKIIQLDGFNASGSTALYALDLAADTWSVLGTARPNPAGTAPASNSVYGTFDGTLGYYVNKDRKIYSHDPAGDVHAGPLATLPGTFAEWRMASDGVRVAITGITGTATVTLYLLDVTDSSFVNHSFTAAGIAALADATICWDYIDRGRFFIVVNGAPSSGAAGKKFELWEYSISDQTFAQIGATQTFTSAASNRWGRALTFHTDTLYLLIDDGTLYAIDPDDATATAKALFGSSCDFGCSLWAVSDTQLLGIGNSGTVVKRYTIASNSWAAIADIGDAPISGVLGDWAAAYYTMPIAPPVVWRQNGDAIAGAWNIGGTPIGGSRVFPLELEALTTLSGRAVIAPAGNAFATYSVSLDNVTFAASVDLPDLAVSETQAVYYKVVLAPTTPPVTLTSVPRVV